MKKKQERYVHGYYQLIVRLDDEDKAILIEYCQKNKKKKTDVMREFIRSLASMEVQ